MVNIFNYLKIVYQDIKQESSQNLYFGTLLLLLLTIPLGYAVNNIALGLFIASVIFKFKKGDFKIDKNLLLPILLYLLMALSVLWSISATRTLKALPKEISLLIIPLTFFFIKNFTLNLREKILKYYSYGIVGFAIFYLLKATVRFILTDNTDVFFYHELVTKDVNAIHVSVYFSIAFFYFLSKKSKTLLTFFALSVISLLIFLLSSKNIIVVFLALSVIYYLFYTETSRKIKIRNMILIGVAVASLGFIGKVRARFMAEFQSNVENSVAQDSNHTNGGLVYNVTIKQAWENDSFKPNDYFSGTAFRAYQLRIFKELMHENNAYLTGFGLNASYLKIYEKAQQYNLFMGDDSNAGYQGKNFHNQYIQNFAELGIFGFLLLIALLFINTKNAIQSKDFRHIVFAILMISLFLTESFLWRQRGVMFFTLMYCIFNAREYVNLSKTE